ncbi:PHD-type domain-containing protein [Trichonephila inaurata madagascariensis]|uniref:PHD-type domain-containing protein n=1 Tax=Trichonephila inaurata madagascariensis TaxID=2747483 RepID=A0A8X6J5B2_9ARAC|nr:PHD-type domain-containing protein [Trichonephila inaurata madagascariensis]
MMMRRRRMKRRKDHLRRKKMKKKGRKGEREKSFEKKPDTVSQKVELKPVSVSIVREQIGNVKEPVKLDVPKTVETASAMKKDNVPSVEPTGLANIKKG